MRGIEWHNRPIMLFIAHNSFIIYFCIVEVDKRNCDKCENNKIYRNAELRKLRK